MGENRNIYVNTISIQFNNLAPVFTKLKFEMTFLLKTSLSLSMVCWKQDFKVERRVERDVLDSLHSLCR